MARLDAKFRSGAKKVLDKLVGSSATVTLTERADEADYDPSTGAVSSSPATFDVRSSPVLQYEDRLVDGDLIQAGDSFVVIDELELEAKSATGLDRGWKLNEIGSSVVWQVVRVGYTKGGTQTALRKVQLRK